ncbi:MAG: hypothetical protein ABIQ90_02075 [Polaromonas sp.]
MSTPKQLKVRFPYMFAGKNSGISVSRGHVPIIEKLSADIDALLGEDKQKFHWTQCKEKFGAARWYWALARLNGLIHADFISGAKLDSLAGGNSRNPGPAFKEPLMTRLIELIQAAQAKSTRPASPAVNLGSSTAVVDTCWCYAQATKHNAKNTRAG